MRIAFVLPGLHRTPRGAEVAFEAIGGGLASTGQDHVTLFGSGSPNPTRSYEFVHVWSLDHERFERFPRFPPLRTEYVYEELTFLPALAARYRADAADVTVTCSYPFVNWYLSRRPRREEERPKHVFVTQNGDWPAHSENAEYRLFSCDGLVCTNPQYYERNQARWNAALIPNGVDTTRFSPGPGDRERFGIPRQRPVVLIVSALVASKRVASGLEAVAGIPEAFLVVAGDGPERQAIDEMAADLLPGRFLRLVLPPEDMPELYRSADVLLHLSLGESFGNIYVEALACGLPIVTHDYPLTRWVLSDHGYLVDAASRADLVRGLAAALSEAPGSAGTRSAYAADRFAWETIAADYRRFLLSVVSGTTP